MVSAEASERAYRMQLAYRHSRERDGVTFSREDGHEEVVRHMLVDLMVFADEYGVPFNSVLKEARERFAEETP